MRNLIVKFLQLSATLHWDSDDVSLRELAYIQ